MPNGEQRFHRNVVFEFDSLSPYMSYMEDRLKRKNGIEPPLPTKKPKKYLKPISDKRRIANEQDKLLGSDGKLDDFYDRMRKKMVGVCQCGCGQPSQKKDDTFFRNCICHIFPKRIFKSIATHELNWVERTFWNGHHSDMDNRSMALWKNFADWDDIKEKFHHLVPFLTDDERKTKFYSALEKLVYEKK